MNRGGIVIIAFALGMLPVKAAKPDGLPADPATPDVTASGPMLVTIDAVVRFSPRARADMVREIVTHWAKATAAGIDAPLRIQHFFSEIAAETGGMTALEENLDYSSQGLMRTWPKRFTADLAARYAHDPVALANFVYNGRNGNTANSEDGWLYRGGGLIQLTGRGNYRQRGRDLGLGSQLEDRPEAVRGPSLAFSTACAFWEFSRASVLADRDDIRAVRRSINGGLLGLPVAQIWLARAKRAFRAVAVAESDEAASRADEDLAVLSQLQTLGYAAPSVAAGVERESAVRKGLEEFQTANGLSQTGTLDDDTLYRLTDPKNNQKE